MLVLTLLSLVACSPADRFFVTDNFTDSIELSEDSVADVYALGSELTFNVGERIHLGRSADMQDLELISSDASVIELADVIVTEDDVSANAVAIGAGTSVLKILREGETVHEVVLEVAAADEVALTSKLSLDAGSGFIASSPQKVLVGSFSAFEAEFSSMGRPLAAHAVLGAVSGEAVTVEVEDTTLWEDREWLSIWPTLAGEQAISVLADGETVEDVSFHALDVEDIVGIEIIGNTTGEGVEDSAIIGAVGIDAEGEMVLGVTPTWVMPNGDEWVGDELEYEVDTDYAPVTLTVKFGAAQTEVTIPGWPKAASSSSTIGCSSVEGGGIAWLALAGIAAMVVRRGR